MTQLIRQFGQFGLLGVLFALNAPAAMADSIILRNGSAFDGTVVKADDEKVVFRLTPGADGEVVEMTFERPKVRDIRYNRMPLLSGALAKPAAPEAPAEKPQDAEKPVAAPAETPATPAAPGEATLDPTIRQQMESYIGELSSTDQKIRDVASEKLKAFGESVVPVLADKLSSTSSSTQARSINRLFGDLGDKRVVRLLINQLQGGKDDQSRMEWAWISLRKITGQQIAFSSDSNERRREAQRQEWVSWFATVKESYPAQLGVKDEPAKPTAPAEGAPEEKPATEPATEPEATTQEP